MAELGMHATKIADIAAAADVGVGTFYLHFDTKQELFDELVSTTVARLHAVIETARTQSTDALGQIRAATIAVCRFARDNRAVFRLVFGHGAAYHDVVREAQSRYAADLEAVLRDGIASGEVAPIDPAIAARAIAGTTTQLLAWWTTDEAVPIADLEATLTALTLQGISARSA